MKYVKEIFENRKERIDIVNEEKKKKEDFLKKKEREESWSELKVKEVEAVEKEENETSELTLIREKFEKLLKRFQDVEIENVKFRKETEEIGEDSIVSSGEEEVKVNYKRKTTRQSRGFSKFKRQSSKKSLKTAKESKISDGIPFDLVKSVTFASEYSEIQKEGPKLIHFIPTKKPSMSPYAT
jgi:hypothetical protein